jgi:hypothetical protein
MVGMGFRRIALAQGLLDRPTDRTGAARLTDRDDRDQFAPIVVQDAPRKDPIADHRVSMRLT